MVEDHVLRYALFSDSKGNKMVFPSIVRDDTKGTSINFWECQRICFATGLNREKDDLEVPVVGGMIQLPHVNSICTSPGFLHGGATVYIVSGPQFDEVVNETVLV